MQLRKKLSTKTYTKCEEDLTTHKNSHIKSAKNAYKTISSKPYTCAHTKCE